MKDKIIKTVCALRSVILCFLLFMGGCALFNSEATFDEKLNDIEELSYQAASIGGAIALEQNPQYRPAMEAAYDELNRQMAGGTLTLDSLRGIVRGLPVKELKSPLATLAIGNAIRLFRKSVDGQTEVNAEAARTLGGKVASRHRPLRLRRPHGNRYGVDVRKLFELPDFSRYPALLPALKGAILFHVNRHSRRLTLLGDGNERIHAAVAAILAALEPDDYPVNFW